MLGMLQLLHQDQGNNRWEFNVKIVKRVSRRKKLSIFINKG
jgi:hypothetical protein